ncbi:MAG TPA: DUF4037 domain-containing protein [Anaerolineae bacterium]|nr:DUF4037 domain-containing protein [Anaerolineae bacterium]
MPESILDISHAFFDEIVFPILEREFPSETAQTTFGVFGYGSEVLRLDDHYSRDHHWGIRINALMPEEVYQTRRAIILQRVGAQIPAEWRGHTLQESFSHTSGLDIARLEGHLLRTIGIDHPPQTYAEWLAIPEEDITHIVGGEVWHDPLGKFSAVRAALNAYYPEPVRLRRIAHWCRYYSGMGAYALKRAILRKNDYYCNITFTRAIRLAVQLAFLLDKQYFPYDKWTFAYFQRLPRLAAPLEPLVTEAVKLETPWERKLEILNEISDVFDKRMVEDGIIPPHPKMRGSESSGYRLMEHAYAEILKKLPLELAMTVPTWDQIYFERWHSGYVTSLDMDVWDGLLNLKEEE